MLEQPPAEPAGEALIALTRRGDGEAFTTLYHQYRERIKGYLRFAAGRDAAEELTQETFCLAWRHVHQLREISRFPAWLMQIARNVFRQWLAAQSTRPEPVGELESLIDRLPGVLLWSGASTGNTASDDRILLLQVLRQVPEIYLLPLYLHYAEGMSMAEIASLTGYPLSTVKWRLHRGLELCRLLARKPAGRRESFGKPRKL